MIKFASLIINKGVAFNQIAMVFISIIPTFLEIAIPLATLLGVMLAFARFSGDSELIVMRASGISLSQLIRPVLLFGILSAVLCLYVSLQLRPWGYKSLAKSLFEIARSKSTAGLDAGIFNKLGLLTLYAEEIDHSSGEIDRVLIDDRRGDDTRKIVTAQSGQIISDPVTQTITFHLKDGYIHEIIENKYVLTNYSTNNITMSSEEVYDPSAQKKKKRARMMSNVEISDEFEKLTQMKEQPVPYVGLSPEELSQEALKEKITKLKLERGRRYSMPFAAFILALLAMPLGIHPPRTQRTWGAGLSVTVGMLVFVIYYGLFSFGLALGESGSLNPYLALWIPNIVAILVTFYTLMKMKTEAWDSIAEGAEEIVEYIKRPFSKYISNENYS